MSNEYNDDSVIKEEYGNGLTKDYTYDSDGNIILESYSNGNRYNWTYDENGNVLSYKDNNFENNYTYDSDGNLLSYQNSEGFNISYSNSDDNINSVKYENNQEIKSQTANYSISDDNSNTPSKVEIDLISGDKCIDIADTQNSENKSILSNGNEILSSKINKNEIGVNDIEYSDGRKLYYTYDNFGNIISVSNGTNVILSYEYDGFGQLIRENNVNSNTTVIYTYDTAGNILKSETYEYSSDNPTNKISENTYTYGDSNWKDLLTSFNNQNITYDEIGNPLSYRNSINLTWEGRNLTGFKSNNNNVTYTYNSDGIRTSKTIDNIKTTYQHEDSKIISETTNGNIKWYIYDDSNNILGFQYNNKTYYFEKNAQGDITRIYDDAGNFVSEYSYDAWGNITSITGDKIIAKENPFRYRGYYYDNESGFYYYYDSVTGRFLNADFQIDEEYSINSNLFVYCKNNPVKYFDPEGDVAQIIVAGIAISALALMICSTVISLNTHAFRNSWNTVSNCLSYGLSVKFKGIGISIFWAQRNIKNLAISIGNSFMRAKRRVKYQSPNETHHIVARKAWRATTARNILKNVGICVQDSRNLVSLKTGLHRRLHTKSYYNLVNTSVYSAYNRKRGNKKSNVYSSLDLLKRALKIMSAAAPF